MADLYCLHGSFLLKTIPSLSTFIGQVCDPVTDEVICEKSAFKSKASAKRWAKTKADLLLMRYNHLSFKALAGIDLPETRAILRDKAGQLSAKYLRLKQARPGILLEQARSETTVLMGDTPEQTLTRARDGRLDALSELWFECAADQIYALSQARKRLQHVPSYRAQNLARAIGSMPGCKAVAVQAVGRDVLSFEVSEEGAFGTNPEHRILFMEAVDAGLQESGSILIRQDRSSGKRFDHYAVYGLVLAMGRIHGLSIEEISYCCGQSSGPQPSGPWRIEYRDMAEFLPENI